MTTTAGHSFYIGPIGFFYNQVNDTGSSEPLAKHFAVSITMLIDFSLLFCFYFACIIIATFSVCLFKRKDFRPYLVVLTRGKTAVSCDLKL
jgi:ammonia channel protein AmtB